MALSPNTVLTAATTAATIIRTAQDIMRPVHNAIDVGLKLNEKINQGGMNSSLSLTAYTKQTTLRSRVYIDASLIDEPVLAKLIRTIHTMYIGLILNALQMNQFVTQGKTVQSYVGTVATEALAEPYHDVRTDITNQIAALEVFNKDESTTILDEEGKRVTYTRDELEKELARRKAGNLYKLGIPDLPKVSKGADQLAVKDIQLVPPTIVPLGKLVEVTLTSPDNPTASTKLLLAVQMIPYLIPANLAAMFINKDTSLSFSQRIMQWKAGEISFWHDLLFQVDRINKSAEISKNDPNKVFYDFMANVAKKDRATLTKNLAQQSATKSHNLANSVMIFSTETVARARAESGIDLYEHATRERYFKDTYAMIIAVVDTLHSLITLYFNGIDDIGVYSFSQFDGPETGGTMIDLIKALSTFTAGKAPARF